MATTPFPAAFEAALKTPQQGGIITASSGFVVNPRFFCCISGTTVGVDKDPVAMLKPRSGRRVCTCATVTVDYSDSWSPSSTINAVEINWGDGNTTNPAWPGAGTSSHPGVCGGYALPGTYTVTLTVTDLLGATGVDTFQIKVVNCDTFATIEAFCSTNGVGNPIWFTNDAGGNWADRSGHVLAGASAYDLKINPFSVPQSAYSPTDNTDELWLWTCTDYGLYNCFDGAKQGNSWGNVPIPLEQVRTVLPSKVEPLEVYVLGSNTLNNRVWLYRSIDYGFNWTSLELAPLVGFYKLPAWGWTNLLDMSVDGYAIYVGLMDDSNNPVVLRVPYDLSAQTELVATGLGSWAGVKADHNYAGTVWFHGNFGGNTTIYVSNDYGTTPIDVSPPTWTGGHGSNLLVCPLLPSVKNPYYVFACENDQLESAITTNFGTDWAVSALNTPFECQCGERGWWDDYLVFIGNVNVEAEHLQLSINLGESMWTERSGGITATDPVTSIQILWEHGLL